MNILYRFIIILVWIYALLIPEVANGQVIKNKSYEFFLVNQYDLVNPATNNLGHSTIGIDYQSFLAARKIYRINTMFFNYVGKGKLRGGVSLYSDVEEEFTSLSSLSGTIAYRVLDTESLRVETAMRFNGWNYLVKGNQFFAGSSTFAFNMDAGVALYWKEWEFSFGANNMVPVTFIPLEQSILLVREMNLYLKRSFSTAWEIYQFLGMRKGLAHYIGGVVYGFDEKVYAQAQWSNQYGLSIGGYVISSNTTKKNRYRLGLNYGVNQGKNRVSQYRIDLALLFK